MPSYQESLHYNIKYNERKCNYSYTCTWILFMEILARTSDIFQQRQLEMCQKPKRKL